MTANPNAPRSRSVAFTPPLVPHTSESCLPSPPCPYGTVPALASQRHGGRAVPDAPCGGLGSDSAPRDVREGPPGRKPVPCDAIWRSARRGPGPLLPAAASLWKVVSRRKRPWAGPAAGQRRALWGQMGGCTACPHAPRDAGQALRRHFCATRLAAEGSAPVGLARTSALCPPALWRSHSMRPVCTCSFWSMKKHLKCLGHSYRECRKSPDGSEASEGPGRCPPPTRWVMLSPGACARGPA